jgi:phage/plasmid-like protein (TIGR03299 family)
MSHNIGTMADGRSSMAFRGSRDDIWHRLGNQHQDGWTVDDWAKNSGLDWEAHKCPAFVQTLLPNLDMIRVPERHFICRADNGHVLSPGAVTDRYQIVQPRAVLDWFEQYVAVDPRFQLDVAGSLHGGEMIWATAVFNGDQKVAGEDHKARLLMSTTFDGSGATINRGCVTRVVCNNTLDAALAEKIPTTVRTRHNAKFYPVEVGKELATIVQSFDRFKAMGDALAAVHFTDVDVSRFFKLTLDIDPKDKPEEISTRKRNQFDQMVQAYQVGTRREGLDPRTGWAMLNAVTRYADHDRSVRGSDGTPNSLVTQRFGSAVLDSSGSGALMKAHAVQLLDDMTDGDLLRKVSNATAQYRSMDDVTDILKQPLRTSR